MFDGVSDNNSESDADTDMISSEKAEAHVRVLLYAWLSLTNFLAFFRRKEREVIIKHTEKAVVVMMKVQTFTKAIKTEE